MYSFLLFVGNCRSRILDTIQKRYMCFRRRSRLCGFLIISNLARLHTNGKLFFYTHFLFVLFTTRKSFMLYKNTIKSSEKFFCVCNSNKSQKYLKFRNNGEKEYNIESVINYKSVFLFSFRLLRRDWIERKQKMKQFGRIH